MAVTTKDRKNTRSSESERYLEFSLGEEVFAIPLLVVREVLAVPTTTPIPYSPKHFRGIMNLRGQVISVIDLRLRMDVKPKESQTEMAVIIIDVGIVQVGVIVDSVNTVLALNPESISQTPATDTKCKTDHMLGVYHKNEGLGILLDVAKVLDIKDKQIIDSNVA